MEQVLGEQALGLKGVTESSLAIRVGEILGVQGVIVGTVPEYGMRAVGSQELPAVYDKATAEAQGRIDKARSALKSGDKGRIKRTALEAQSDPLAVREINRSQSDTFKGRVNSEVSAVKAKAKELIKKETAKKYGVKPEDVTFLEATNPPKINPETGLPVEKVGQDWDVTPRVKGKDVPVKEVKQIVHDSYHTSATGEKPPSAKGMTDVEHQAAMEDFHRRANETAHRQAVEVVNRSSDEGYGGSQREGTEILTGPKGQDLRDSQQISEVIEHKSNKALVKAKQYEKVGDFKAAQGEHMEQALQAQAMNWQEQMDKQASAVGQMFPEVAGGGGSATQQAGASATQSTINSGAQSVGATVGQGAVSAVTGNSNTRSTSTTSSGSTSTSSTSVPYSSSYQPRIKFVDDASMMGLGKTIPDVGAKLKPVPHAVSVRGATLRRQPKKGFISRYPGPYGWVKKKSAVRY